MLIQYIYYNYDTLMKTKLGAAAVVVKSGIEVNIVRCSTKNAQEVICGKDTDRCTIIRGVFRKKVHAVII